MLIYKGMPFVESKFYWIKRVILIKVTKIYKNEHFIISSFDWIEVMNV